MIKMANKSKAQETAEKYIARMKVARDEAKKAFEKSMSELDEIGNEMYEDMRVNLKDSGVDLDKMQAKMKDDLMKGKEEMTKEFWHIESRLVKFGEDVEKEIRKTFKQS
jgi:predicted metallo-beta-lactamase superfamily hydrolase